MRRLSEFRGQVFTLGSIIVEKQCLEAWFSVEFFELIEYRSQSKRVRKDRGSERRLKKF